jgi:hypothetical protein
MNACRAKSAILFSYHQGADYTCAGGRCQGNPSSVYGIWKPFGLETSWSTPMSKKTIERNLKKALLDGDPHAQALFEYELEEHVDEYVKSKQEDGDEFFFAVTEHRGDVACS